MINISEKNKEKLADKLQSVMANRGSDSQFLYHTEIWINNDGEVIGEHYLSQNSWKQYDDELNNHRIAFINEINSRDIDFDLAEESRLYDYDRFIEDYVKNRNAYLEAVEESKTDEFMYPQEDNPSIEDYFGGW